MEEQPLVSVIIPTYKRPDRLSRAVNSVLNQTYTRVEVIVVDDNNPDTEGRARTELIMEQFADNPRVRYIKHKQNKNGSAARNTGARASKGEYVAFLDDDDEFLPGKIGSQINRLCNLSDDYAVCYSKFALVTPNGHQHLSTENREGNLLLQALTQELMIAAGSNLIVKKKAFVEIDGFDESFSRNQDLEFLARLLKKYKIAFSDEFGLLVNVQYLHQAVDEQVNISRYVQNFKPMVEELSEEEQVVFYKNISKLRFIDFIRVKHDLKSAFLMIKSKELTFFEAIHYLLEGGLRYINNRR